MVRELLIAKRMFCFAMALLMVIVCGVRMNRLSAQGATATILGTVTDTSGAAIPDVTVQVKNLGTGVTQSIAADAQGRFRT
jgi:hypothetical protein